MFKNHANMIPFSYPFLRLSFLVVHTVYILGCFIVIQNFLPNSPITVSRTDMLSGFQAFDHPIYLWLFSLCLLMLNRANFHCVRSYICSFNTTGVYNLTTR